jgi:hypothetical protein
LCCLKHTCFKMMFTNAVTSSYSTEGCVLQLPVLYGLQPFQTSLIVSRKAEELYIAGQIIAVTSLQAAWHCTLLVLPKHA